MAQPVIKAHLKHFAYIDAVRGYAFLAVLAVHISLCVGNFPGHWIAEGGGSYGVQLFFLASAVTLGYSMASRSAVDRFAISSFYLRRIFRIAPLFWAAMIFYWAFPHVMPSFWLGQWAPYGVRPSYYVVTALFLHGWNPHTFNCIVPGGWSIAVEMSFYAVFPFLFALLNSTKRAFAAVIVGCVAEHFSQSKMYPLLHLHWWPDIPDSIWGFFQGYSFPTQLIVFLIGILTFHVLRSQTCRRISGDLGWSLSLLSASGLILLSTRHHAQTAFIPLYIVVVTALALFVVSISGNVVPLVVNPFIRYIGKISYSCYLVHFAVLGGLCLFFRLPLDADHPVFNAGSGVLNLLLFLKLSLLTLALTMVFATVTLHGIENPGIALGKRFIIFLSTWRSEAPEKKGVPLLSRENPTIGMSPEMGSS